MKGLGFKCKAEVEGSWAQVEGLRFRGGEGGRVYGLVFRYALCWGWVGRGGGGGGVPTLNPKP